MSSVIGKFTRFRAGNWWMVFLLLAFVVSSGCESKTAPGLRESGKKQTICPVMGREIDPAIHTDYKGKRVYFCCSDCVDEFKKDPEKYMKKMRDEGVELEPVEEKSK